MGSVAAVGKGTGERKLGCASGCSETIGSSGHGTWTASHMIVPTAAARTTTFQTPMLDWIADAGLRIKALPGYNPMPQSDR